MIVARITIRSNVYKQTIPIVSHFLFLKDGNAEETNSPVRSAGRTENKCSDVMFIIISWCFFLFLFFD